LFAATAGTVGLGDYGGDFDVGLARRWMKVGTAKWGVPQKRRRMG